MDLFNMFRKKEFDEAMVKLVVPEERPIKQELDRDWWLNFQQQNWHEQLDQDEAAVQDFLTLGER